MLYIVFSFLQVYVFCSIYSYKSLLVNLSKCSRLSNPARNYLVFGLLPKSYIKYHLKQLRMCNQVEKMVESKNKKLVHFKVDKLEIEKLMQDSQIDFLR